MQGQPNTETVLHLIALQDQVSQACRDGDQQVEQDLHLQLARVCWQHKRFDEAMLAFSRAYVLTLFTRDESARLSALLGEGRFYLRSHQPEQAGFLLEEGLELAREQANRWAEAECLCGLAHTSLLKGDPHRALRLAEQARVISREWGNQATQADVMNLLAAAHTQCGQYNQADALHREALLLAREWNASEIEAAHLSNLGILRICQLAQPEQGMEDLRRALALYKEQEDDEGMAQALTLLAAGGLHLQEWEMALRYAEAAQQLAQGLRWLEHRLHFIKADALTGLGQREEALRERGLVFASLYPTKALLFRALFEDHHAALAAAQARGDQREEATQLLFLARAQIHSTGLRGYLSYYDQALAVYRDLGDLYELGSHLTELGVTLALTYPGMRLPCKRARALAYWRAGLAILREIRRPLAGQVGRPEESELDAIVTSDGEEALMTRYEERELERLKERWGEAAYLRARSSSERYYRALMTSLVPLGDTIEGIGAGSGKRMEVCL